ncbi:MAG: TRAP transporter large permease [Minwuia sp.]|uniref:TRAP transporter large permease n=1 Tax=Minwuia sp. TaxID=2493630 RepID=UPI003A854A8A
MEWWVTLLIAGGLLLGLFFSGIPIFLAFLLINVGGVVVFLGPNAFGMVVNSVFDTTTTATLTAIPLFVLMGEILFRSGSTNVLFDAIDSLIGRVRGRQYVLAMSLATVFGALSGSNMAVAAMMGRTVYPVMRDRGYDSRLSIGVILAGASLAPIIPPSVLAIIIATLANASVAGLLVAGILPGLLISVLCLGYALIRCTMNPALAPSVAADTGNGIPSESALRQVLKCTPFLTIIASVMGFILTGVATPSESAATGVVGALVTAAIFRRLSLRMIWESLGQAAIIASMILVIMATSTMFSQLLAFSGATRQLASIVLESDMAPGLILLMMMVVVFVFCMFIDQVALMLVIIPIYLPVVEALQFDPMWFWLLMLLNVVIGGITPPFGYAMFAFKGVVPDVDLRVIFGASLPIVAIFLIAMIIIYLIPSIATFLPGLL